EMAASGHDPDVVLTDQRGHPIPGGLDQAAPEAENVMEELRRRSPPQRPQTGSGSAGGDDGVEVRVHDFSVSESGHRFTEVARRVGCGPPLPAGGDNLTLRTDPAVGGDRLGEGRRVASVGAGGSPRRERWAASAVGGHTARRRWRWRWLRRAAQVSAETALFRECDCDVNANS